MSENLSVEYSAPRPIYRRTEQIRDDIINLKAKIEEILLKLTDYKNMEIIYVVDETLIGGLVIHLDDKMIDSSIRTKLDVMKNSLIENPSV